MPKYLLIGPSGVGKSTALELLSEYDDIDTYDLDQMLEEHGKMKLGDYVALLGWGNFFEKSREIIDSIQSENNVVIAVGAGSIEHMDSHQWYIEQNTISLIGDPKIIYKRGDRQMYHRTLESFENTEYSAWRRNLYKGTKYKIDVTKLTSKEVAERILDIIDGVEQ